VLPPGTSVLSEAIGFIELDEQNLAVTFDSLRLAWLYHFPILSLIGSNDGAKAVFSNGNSDTSMIP
jgi:hypothetical protein